MPEDLNKEIVIAIKSGELNKLPGLLAQGFDMSLLWMFLVAAPNEEQALALTDIILQHGGDPKSAEAVFGSLSKPKVLKKLLDAGADANIKWNKYGKYFNDTVPIQVAADNGFLESVKYLIAAGADVNALNQAGGSALLFACDHGYKEVAEALLEAGANPEIADKSGRTPLELALKNQSLKSDLGFIKRLETPNMLERTQLKTSKEPVTDEMIGQLPKLLTQNKEFVSWLKATGIIRITKGSKSLSSINPAEYEEEMKALQSWFDENLPHEYVPVAGPGADDWCILYNLDDNKLYDWWHEESDRFKPLDDSLEKILSFKIDRF